MIKTETECKEGYVYIMRIHDLCKIGISVNPVRRERQMNSHSPYKVEEGFVSCWFDDAKKYESILHRKYIKNNDHGEWFKINYENAVSFLTKLCDQYTKGELK